MLEKGGQAGMLERGAEGTASRSTQGGPQRTLRRRASPGTQGGGSPSAAQMAAPSKSAPLVLGGRVHLKPQEMG